MLLCHHGSLGVTARLGRWMCAGEGRWLRDALRSADRGAEGEGDVSAVMPSRFLAGICGKYTSLRTIWLLHVERRAQPCCVGAGAACASAGASGRRRARVPLPHLSLRFRPTAGVRCSPWHPVTGGSWWVARAGGDISAVQCPLSAPCQPS